MLVVNEVSHITNEPFAQTLFDNLRRCPMPMDCFALMPDACKRGSGGGVKYIAMILVGTL